MSYPTLFQAHSPPWHNSQIFFIGEKGYDPKYFHYRVERIFIDDHNVPTIQDMLKFTASVREWMSQDEKNIIAIHCKGGKGRTGTMVCTWLIDSDQFESAKESLDYFGERRTDRSTSTKFQGVETPSQVSLSRSSNSSQTNPSLVSTEAAPVLPCFYSWS